MMTLSEYIHLHGRNVTARRMRISPAAITYMIRDKRDIFVEQVGDRVEVWEFKVLAEWSTSGQAQPGHPERPDSLETASS